MDTPVLDLPINYQTLNVDIEPVAQIRQFGPDSYDVANWVATVAVNSPADQSYALVIPFAIESGTRATAVVVSSSDSDFDETAMFKRPKENIDQFVPYLQKMGLLVPEATSVPNELKSFVKGFKVAKLRIPAGQQILRIHASQKLLPTAADNRSFQLVMYAPLCSFVMAGGQTNLTAILTLPPDFQVPTLQVSEFKVEPLPGQATPGEGSPAATPVQASNNKVYAWHFRNDPKITVSYRYN